LIFNNSKGKCHAWEAGIHPINLMRWYKKAMTDSTYYNLPKILYKEAYDTIAYTNMTEKETMHYRCEVWPFLNG
jgi:hypothetical protein